MYSYVNFTPSLCMVHMCCTNAMHIYLTTSYVARILFCPTYMQSLSCNWLALISVVNESLVKLWEHFSTIPAAWIHFLHLTCIGISQTKCSNKVCILFGPFLALREIEWIWIWNPSSWTYLHSVSAENGKWWWQWRRWKWGQWRWFLVGAGFYIGTKFSVRGPLLPVST